ncbi:MAG: isoaspartyl peptidase/L-asparaginase [Bacteroidota bacterium]
MVKLIVHGGAWNIPDAAVTAHLRGVTQAVAEVFPKLQQGLSALDAVEQAVNVMEADPTFDAGRGSFLNELGKIELDAMIMDGTTLDFGAVAALQNFLHPVSIARKVMDQTEHCMLVGAGANRFALRAGFEALEASALLTERELAFYEQIKNNPQFRTHHPFESRPSDTVGAVAIDEQGRLAAATSTGGTARKLQGRVGDSPIIGAGAYADNQLGAASATGWGESILKVMLSKTVCDLLAKHPAMEAAQQGVSILQNRVGGLGGVIGLSANGTYARAHNTPRMAHAWADASGKVHAAIQC